MDIPEIVFKLAVCAFMIITIIRETSHYRFYKNWKTNCAIAMPRLIPLKTV